MQAHLEKARARCCGVREDPGFGNGSSERDMFARLAALI
jgi:hypothetical protein